MSPFQMREAEMSHAVVMHQIAMERGHVLCGAPLLEAHFVVTSGIVHQGIEPPKLFHRLSNGFLAIVRSVEINADQTTPGAATCNFRLQFLAGPGVAVHNYRHGALVRARTDDRCSNTLGATCDDHDLAFQLQVHALTP